MRAPLPPLINALLDPARYPDPAQQVELIETHASWLLLAGDYVYKIKKPIVLPFLDYGTLAQRRACCEAELRLNRRFSAQIYLDVVGITGSPENPQIGGPNKENHAMPNAVECAGLPGCGQMLFVQTPTRSAGSTNTCGCGRCVLPEVTHCCDHHASDPS